MPTVTKSQGFSLIEIVIFIVIVGIAVAAIGLQFSKNVQHSAEPLLRQKALAVAHSHMDALQGKLFADVTSYTDTSIAGFDVTVVVSSADWSDSTSTEIIPAAAIKKIDLGVNNTAINETLNFTLYRVNY